MAHKLNKDDGKIVLFLYREGGKAEIVCDNYFTFLDIVDELNDTIDMIEFCRYPVNPTFKDAFLQGDE